MIQMLQSFKPDFQMLMTNILNDKFFEIWKISQEDWNI